MKYIAVILMSISACCVAQNALVVQLSTSDATQAKQLYDAKVAADKAWDDLNSRIRGDYKGIDYGFEFSTDFRFVVPRSTMNSGLVTINQGACWPYVATPSIGGTFVSPGTFGALTITN